MKRWWSRRECIERELRRLEGKGFRFTPPETIPDQGRVSLKVWTEIDGDEHEVEVVFPDLFPYFRFEVFAPSLDLPFHQNRLEKNLCLLGRGAAYRPESDSVAEFLSVRLQNLIQSVRTESLEEAAGLEDQQAEPETVYYPYSRPGVVLVDGSWVIPSDLSHGCVELGTDQSTGPFYRLAVLELKAPDGTVLFRLPTEVARLFRWVGQGRWVRRDSHLFEKEPAEYFRRVQEEDSGSPPRIRGGGSEQRIYLVTAPEQGSWRGQDSTGWVAVTEVKRRKTSSREYALLQAARIGRDDLQPRVPELAPLQEKTVAVVGLGSLGAPAALALAQAGIGELRLIDHDWVDPGTSVRWPLGISEAGNIKTHSISHFIAQNYPYSRIPKFPNGLQKVLQEVEQGAARDNSPYPQPHGVGGYANIVDFNLLAEVFDGADVLLDTTGEENVQYFLGHFADRLGIPYVTAHGSFGGWGGAVFRRMPGSTSGCWWCLEKHLHEGNLPDPPGSKVEVQPLGCGDRTFTGAGFDMQTVALAAVRGVVEILSKYPSADWDLLVISFRDEKGRAVPPKFEGLRVPRHPACTACSEGDRQSGSAKVA